MDKPVILQGKNLENLINTALETLNRKKDDVDIEIMEKGVAVMGINIKDYKIKVWPKKSEKKIDDTKTQDVVDISYQEKRNGYFSLEYEEDGVYLIIDNTDVKNIVTLEEVLSKIKKKNVKNFDIDSIKNTLDTSTYKRNKIAPSQEEETIDETVLIEISKDKMKVFLTLIPPDGGVLLTYEDIIKKIMEKVQCSLKKNIIKDLVEKRIYNKQMLIGEGKDPVDGRDGYIEYKFNTKSNNSPEILEDGKVNYRNLGLINNVNEGQILATIQPPDNGEVGFDVFGKEIFPKAGKDVKFKFGKNVRVTEDGMNLVSEKEGEVSFLNDKVSVLEVHNVNGNVDNSTGNINFNGAVKVQGNIMTGFKVTATGDIEISGVVEGAILKSEENIILHRGVQGYGRADLIARGEIAARFIENAKLYAHGDIKSEAIMHSETNSENSVIVMGKKGLIVGGICRARKEVKARVIGSEMETKTVIEVGVDPNLKCRYESLKDEILELKNNMEKLDKSIMLLSKLSKRGRLTKSKKEMLVNAINTKKFLQGKYEKSKDTAIELESRIELLSKGRIVVQEKIYPGVKIIIGNSIMYIRDELDSCIIYRELGEIKVAPYDQ